MKLAALARVPQAAASPVISLDQAASPVGGFAAMLLFASPPAKVLAKAPDQLPEPPAEMLDSPWQAPRMRDVLADLPVALFSMPSDVQPVDLSGEVVLPTPAPEATLTDGEPTTSGERALLEVPDQMDILQVLPVDPESPPSPVVEGSGTPALSVESSSSSTPKVAAAPPPVETVPLPPDEPVMRFQKLTHNQLSLRVEDVDGVLDIELSREQAALQLRVIAPVEALPDLLGLGSALESALSAIGLQLESYDAMARKDEESGELDGEGAESEPGEGEGPSEDEPEVDGDRLLNLVV